MKPIVFRLSSLGDLILSTSFLETVPESVQVDWVTSSDFEFVLRGHPKIKRLWVYHKTSGLLGWIRIVSSIAKENYDVYVDLHGTMRTRLAIFLLRAFTLLSLKKAFHFSISKERIRTFLLLALKTNIPKSWLPSPYWTRFASLAFAVSREERPLRKPSYLPILENSGLSEQKILDSFGLKKGQYFCMMPASRWKSKEWRPESFGDLAQSLYARGLFPVLMGRERDRACREVRENLERRGLPYQSFLAETDFRISAFVLKSAAFFVGCDTGMSHLAEAVGCKSFVLFGPTRPEIGFGPCRTESRSISAKIACAPCSKSGKHCYRIMSPHECMKRLLPQDVEREIFS